MIHFRIKELMKERGIKAPYQALRKLGITHAVAQKYMRGQKLWIVCDHIEKLCLFFRCEPNDLFVWIPDAKSVADPGQPLHRIKARKPFSLEEAVKGLSPDEIKKRFVS